MTFSFIPYEKLPKPYEKLWFTTPNNPDLHQKVYNSDNRPILYIRSPAEAGNQRVMKFRKFFRHEAAASLVEMALLIALVAVIAIPSVSWVGENVKTTMQQTGEVVKAGTVIEDEECLPGASIWPECANGG